MEPRHPREILSRRNQAKSGVCGRGILWCGSPGANCDPHWTTISRYYCPNTFAPGNVLTRVQRRIIHYIPVNLKLDRGSPSAVYDRISGDWWYTEVRRQKTTAVSSDEAPNKQNYRVLTLS